ncbi:MAG TPA: CbtB domain-containing protein [Bauldia sp.]|nr:CbtB domain-containing protein [Bauldia sp.]
MTTLASRPIAAPVATRAPVALAALLIGLALFFTTGFAWPSALHNATHDTRHALGLPCH